LKWLDALQEAGWITLRLGLLSAEISFPAAIPGYCGRVLVRLGHVLLIVALLAATGGHWALLQTVAWTNMLADNLRTESLGAAIAKTFDGEHPCSMCKAISKGKKSEQKTEFPLLAKKLDFVSERGVFIFSAPSEFRPGGEIQFLYHPISHRPPVPPPRGCFT
jgi:hypothetical protein